MFQSQRDKYDMFLDVMKDFKAQRFAPLIFLVLFSFLFNLVIYVGFSSQN